MTVVAVLICLIVITLISGAVLKVGLAHRDLVRAQERRLQAEWLAESGVQRALARLAVDRDYAGETWPFSAADLGLPERPPADRHDGRIGSSGGRRHDRGRASHWRRHSAGGSASRPTIRAIRRRGRGIPNKC